MWLITLSLVCFLASAACTLLQREVYIIPLWTVALASALLWGARDWWKVRRFDRFDIIAALLLYGLALFFRAGFDLTSLPAFVDNDELHLLGEGVKLATGHYRLLDIFWVGIPIFGLFPQALMFQVMEPSIFASRLGEALFASLVVVAVYDLGRTLVHRRVGLSAAFLVAVSHEAIHWARVGIPFILVSTFAAIMMACAVRAVRGGTYLSWVGAGIAMGFGVVSYQAGYFIPACLCASSLLLVCDRKNVPNVWRGIGVYSFIVVIGMLVAAPPLLKIFANLSWSNSRPATLLISNRTLANLANTYGIPRTPVIDVLWHHLIQSATVLWNGSDAWAQYGARYPLIDPVLGVAILLLPLALLFGNRILAWMSLTWMIVYLIIGVLLVATPPTYHRISTIVVFAALGGAAMVDWITPKRLKIIALVAFCFGSAFCNLRYYFSVYPTQRRPEFSWVLTRLMAPYQKTHAVVDASHVGLISPSEKRQGALVYHNELIKSELPELQRIEVLKKGDIWNFDKVRRSKVLVLTRSEVASEVGHRPPPGFVVMRRWEDRSIGAPRTQWITVYELDREGS